MKKTYENFQLQIIFFEDDDVIKTSGTVNKDETLYPIPDGWEGV